MSADTALITFADLKLPANLLETLTALGYESPSPIQAATIPSLLEGRDVLGQAQTGTGKTAAFALPILARLDLKLGKPQALVLTPTRELAIQVAEAFQRYASKMPGFHVLPIYGGQGYGPQLHGLSRGTHIVVGTPGRVKDHLNRGTLDLSQLKYAVLDEADEMLRMGFIDDVEMILEKMPKTRQVALFSATMPPPIRRIAQNHLKDPAEVTIKTSTATTKLTRQRYWLVSGINKLDALTRILEAETFEAMIVFVRTKIGTEELAERLAARGFAAAAINGDLIQAQREKTIERLKNGQLDILVATDVAARGLDVERVSHVLNYDIPYDSEAYVHRIGRTGRAGRSGEAILFVTPRERHLLHSIERSTRQPIEAMTLPSIQAVNDQRIARFHQRITEGLAASDIDVFRRLVEDYSHRHEVPELDVAAALARQLQGDTPLLLGAGAESKPEPASFERAPPRREDTRPGRKERPGSDRPSSSSERPSTDRPRPERAASSAGTPFAGSPRPTDAERERPAHKRKGPAEDAPALERFRVEIGAKHGLKPGNLVGAIANEAGVESRFMGKIEIDDEHSIIELPVGMPDDTFQHLKKVWVSGKQMRISRVDDLGATSKAKREFKSKVGTAAPKSKRPRE